jgi:5-formyltetrahydrofolate cyclo-ligase
MMKSESNPNSHLADITWQKRQLRHSCREARDELGEDRRQHASQAICAQLETWPVFQRAEVILGYMPMRGEVDLTSLMVRHPQKRWVLPRIIPEENHRMVFHSYLPGRLVRHPYGMAEPAADLPIIPASEVQLALVPGLAFDKQGRRLGYGGGYFDRFLGDFCGVSVGVVFQALLLDQLPFGEHDVAVMWIVTEMGLLHIKS